MRGAVLGWVGVLVGEASKMAGKKVVSCLSMVQLPCSAASNINVQRLGSTGDCSFNCPSGAKGQQGRYKSARASVCAA